jgi:hypothetical protein
MRINKATSRLPGVSGLTHGLDSVVVVKGIIDRYILATGRPGAVLHWKRLLPGERHLPRSAIRCSTSEFCPVHKRPVSQRRTAHTRARKRAKLTDQCYHLGLGCFNATLYQVLH